MTDRISDHCLQFLELLLKLELNSVVKMNLNKSSA